MSILFLLTAMIISSLLGFFFQTPLTYSLGIPIAVLIFQGKNFTKLFDKKIRLHLIIIAIFLPLLYVGILFLLQKTSSTFQTLTPTLIISIFLAAFFEETGWRGYLFEKSKHFGWIKMNVLIGLFWSLWHLPAILTNNYILAQPLALGLLIFTFNLIFLSFILSLLRQKSGGILIPTVFHAFHNLAFFYLTINNTNIFFSESGVILATILICVGVLTRAKITT